MKNLLIVSTTFALLTGALFAQKKPAATPDGATLHSALLKVNVTQQAWNQRIPWQKTSPSSRRGLGVLLDKNQILVTAQLIADAIYIELEQAESGRKLPAKVKAVDYDANLALLEPTETPGEFFTGLKPMTIDENAKIGDELQAWQLDRVGELIRSPVTINKILVSRYFLETSMFLVYEANGIIRSEANSFTLPVIKGGKLAGLLLSYDSKNQTALVLPGPIIKHFLKDVADGNYQGFPSLGVEYQTTLDEQFKEYLGMTKDQQGVYVSAVSKGGSAESVGVKVGDIILEVNGHVVDARGDYKDAQFGRLNVHTDEYEKQGRRKVVILSAALPTRSTQGYERLGGLILTQVNGKPINDLTDLEKAFKESQNGINKIEFEEAPKIIYLDAITAERDNMNLLGGVYRLGRLKRIE
ncbi:MAG: PDZ domain-containing protein [Verrucomicrobia bacterium]|nr:PDZ domain-containing protein [Verrucomicrobiota bacterium]